MFDITIVSQSFVYRPRHHKAGLLRSHVLDEEATGLLSADSQHIFDESETLRRSRRSTAATQE